MNDLNEKTIKGLHWVGSIKIITQASSWVITIFVARLLSPSDYGLMGIAIIVIGFAIFFGEFGLGTAIIQKKDLQKVQLDTIFWIAILNGILLFLLFYILSPFIASFFNSPRVIPIIRVLSVNFILASVATVALSILNKDLKFKERSFIEFTSSMTANIITLLFAYLGLGVWSLVIGSVGRNVIILILLSFYQKITPGFQFSLKATSQLIKFGANIVGSRLLWYFYSKTDFVIVGKVVGEQGLGIYSMAFQIASTPLDRVAEIVNPVAYASFSKLQDNLDELRIYFLQFTKGLCLILFPALCGLSIIADDLVRCVLTEKWDPIIFPVEILCFVGMIRGATSPIASLLNARGKAFLNIRYNLVNIIVMPICFLIGAIMNGITGVVLAWILIYPILACYIVWLGLKEIKLKLIEYVSNLFPIIVSIITMGVILYMVKWQLGHLIGEWLRLFLLISLGAISYLVSLYVFSPGIKDEILGFFLLKKT